MIKPEAAVNCRCAADAARDVERCRAITREAMIVDAVVERLDIDAVISWRVEEAAVLVDAEAFFFLDFVSFGTAASFASASPVTLATSPFCHREKLWWMALAIKEWIY